MNPENANRNNKVINDNSENLRDITMKGLEKASAQMSKMQGASEDSILPKMLKEVDIKSKKELRYL